jgi:uncharacterized protein YndB with AHSA1/START domain
MSLTIQLSQTIDRPVSDVFRFFADDHVRNHPRWDPHMHLEQVTEGPLGEGTIIRRRITRGEAPVTGEMKVVEYKKDEAFGTITRDGESEIRGRVTFKPENGGKTTLTMNVEFMDMDPSMEERITGMMQGSLDNIKKLIESET